MLLAAAIYAADYFRRRHAIFAAMIRATPRSAAAASPTLISCLMALRQAIF